MSCLFDSISFFIENCSSHELRSLMCDYLQKNPMFWDSMRFDQVFGMFDHNDVHGTRTIHDYIDLMRRDCVWGGALEIQAICNMCDLAIDVIVLSSHSRHNVIEFVPTAVTASPRHKIRISWNGFHFEPIHVKGN